jgi:NADH:ubiquinone oxidoreductase subunit 4 (subunit M)
MLRSYQAIMLGEANELTKKFVALSSHDKAVLIIISAAIIALGVYPQPLTELAEPAVKNLLSITK